MFWEWKTRKSAGVAVTRTVYGLIRRGNEARGSAQWSAAAQHFESALRSAPALYHVWMQLGHAYKESGNFREAERAYSEAADLRSMSSEPHLHLGHLYKLTRDTQRAASAYFRAVQLDSTDADAVMELHRQLAKTSGPSREKMLDLLRSSFPDLGMDPSNRDADASNREGVSVSGDQRSGSGGGHLEPTIGIEQPEVIFDVSDLIAYYGRARLPTGIQRVQIETVMRAVANLGREVKICCVFDGRDEWVPVPVNTFLAVAELSLRGGRRNDFDWMQALNRLYLALALTEPLEFPEGACLVNLGTSWWLQNYFLHVRAAQQARKIRYVPLIYDLIPVVMPEHCVSSLIENFISWLVGVFDHASGFLAISEATKRDLLRIGAELGHDIDPATVEVIRLDADFRKPGNPVPDLAWLSKWQLEPDEFVLFVSTIESRKGHVVALDAWIELIRSYGADVVPRLVCVGANGWLNAQVYQRLADEPTLASHVTIISGLSDGELTLLYQQCRFTIYPSLYEGWGLPITEALCYGKPVIASDSSSLPEAGGDLAAYVEAGSSGKLANAVAKMSFDDAYRQMLAGRIACEFNPRTWSDIAIQIEHGVKRLAGTGRSSLAVAPTARLGAYYPVTRIIAGRIWPGIGSGEIFRTGKGWLWPEAWGCWIRPEGAHLTIGRPAGSGALRLAVHVKGLPTRDGTWRVRAAGMAQMEGRFFAGQCRWISFDIPGGDGKDICVQISSDEVETISVSRGDIEQDASVALGILGFFLFERDGIDERSNFLEAVALNVISDFDAYQPRKAEPSA